VNKRSSGIRLALAFCGLNLATSSAWANNGSYLTGTGPYASGMGGVDIALPQDASVAADNPAGMAELGTRLDLYGVLITTETDASFGNPQSHYFSRAILPAPGLVQGWRQTTGSPSCLSQELGRLKLR